MRAKFVKAELLYSSGAQQPTNHTQMQTMPASSQYGTVDYSAFSQPPYYESPPVPVHMPTKVASEPTAEAELKEAADFGSDLQIPVYDGNNFQEEEGGTFLNSFSYANQDFTSNGFGGGMPSDTSGDYFSKPSGSREVSKFDFCTETADDYSPDTKSLVDKMMGLKVTSEPLSDRLEELELISDKQEINEKFSQAKYQIEMGNVDAGNDILNEMMQNKEIDFKKFASLDQHIIQSFAPISD